MGKHFSLVDGLAQDDWSKLLEQAIKPHGTLDLMSEADAVDRIINTDYEATILDCSSVKETKLLIYRLLAQRPESKIIAVTATPTWELIRDLLQAGAVDCIQRTNDQSILQRNINEILSKPVVPPIWLRLLREPRAEVTSILLADNQIEYLKTWQETLERAGYVVVPAATCVEAKRILEKELVDLAIIDVRLEDDNVETDESGLRLATDTAPSISKIILTRHPETDSVKRALAVDDAGKRPAIDFISKKETQGEILKRVRTAVAAIQERKVSKIKISTERFPTIVIFGLLVALGTGILAIITGDARWLLATTLLVIVVVLAVGLATADS
jgi:CheY-like chemotaxis protein